MNNSELLTPFIIELMSVDTKVTQPLFDMLLGTNNEFVYRYCIDHYSQPFNSETVIQKLVFQSEIKASSWRV